jgi:hypothetical protein
VAELGEDTLERMLGDLERLADAMGVVATEQPVA